MPRMQNSLGAEFAVTAWYPASLVMSMLPLLEPTVCLVSSDHLVACILGSIDPTNRSRVLYQGAVCLDLTQ